MFSDSSYDGSSINYEDILNIIISFFTTKVNGSGIGLSITWSIMHLHDGKIYLESQYGRGIWVSILFPVFEVIFFSLKLSI